MENKSSCEPSFDWTSPVISLKGIGEKIAQKLAKLQILTVGDLLLHCPFRYEDRTQLTPLCEICPEQWHLVQGKITAIKNEKSRKKRTTLILSDQTSECVILFFNIHDAMIKSWQVGNQMRCFGQVKVMNHKLAMIHPDYEMIAQSKPQSLPNTLTPIYPSVAGISQNLLRKAIGQVLKQVPDEEDHFAKMLEAPSWVEALYMIHQPSPLINQEDLNSRQHRAYFRLISEELFAFHSRLKSIRLQTKEKNAKPLSLSDHDLHSFLELLPFSLTDAQNNAWQQIRADLAMPSPMLRLVQGDVGCGKTVVCALAALTCVSNQQQVALMAPTEILAEQHLNQFTQWFSHLGYRCALLTGKLSAKVKRSLYENITLGLIHILIGTHALFQDEVLFKDLGLIIIDEQHRFGVNQRLALQAKGHFPHQLMMTATPIPRTLALSHYAHLDMTVIDSLPPNRLPITTLTISQSRREEVIARMACVCEKGQQVYWICTLITESENSQSQAAQTIAQMLQSLLPRFRVGLVHGKMDSREKESVMSAFYQGEIAILVATTVVEVGVNVPNATLMIIENPERLGLAQCHQLRGRIGRGHLMSYCILLYQSPLTEMAQARLRVLRTSCDGFFISEADLELRGEGEVLGIKQTGRAQFKITDLKRDAAIIKSLPSWSDKLCHLPSLQIDQIIERWCLTKDNP